MGARHQGQQRQGSKKVKPFKCQLSLPEECDLTCPEYGNFLRPPEH